MNMIHGKQHGQNDDERHLPNTGTPKLQPLPLSRTSKPLNHLPRVGLLLRSQRANLAPSARLRCSQLSLVAVIPSTSAPVVSLLARLSPSWTASITTQNGLDES